MAIEPAPTLTGAERRRRRRASQTPVHAAHIRTPISGIIADDGRRPYEDVRIEGHLIDSLMVPQIMDDVMDLEGEFEILSFDVGRTKTDISHGRLSHLRTRPGPSRGDPHGGAGARRRGGGPEDAVLAPAPADGVFPDEFYSTTNLETFVRLDGEWVRVERPEMDCGMRVRRDGDGGAPRAETVPLSDVGAGELLVVGHHGIRVMPLARPRESQPFEFMASAVSSEKPKAQIVREVARLLRRVRDEGRLDDRRGRPGRGAHRIGGAARAPHLAPATSARCSAATPSPPTTSSRPSTAPRSAST